MKKYPAKVMVDLDNNIIDCSECNESLKDCRCQWAAIREFQYQFKKLKDVPLQISHLANRIESLKDSLDGCVSALQVMKLWANGVDKKLVEGAPSERINALIKETVNLQESIDELIICMDDVSLEKPVGRI